MENSTLTKTNYFSRILLPLLISILITSCDDNYIRIGYGSQDNGNGDNGNTNQKSSIKINVSGLKPDTNATFTYGNKPVTISSNTTYTFGDLNNGTQYSVDIKEEQSVKDIQTLQTCTLTQNNLEVTSITTPSAAATITLDINCKTKFFFHNEIAVTKNFWITDDTSAGTIELFSGDSSYATRFNDSIYFIAGSGANSKLYKSDGTVSGTNEISGHTPQYLLPVNNYLLFGNHDGSMRYINEEESILSVIATLNATNTYFDPQKPHIIINNILYYFSETTLLKFMNGGVFDIELNSITNINLSNNNYPIFAKPTSTNKIFFAYEINPTSGPTPPETDFQVASIDLNNNDYVQIESSATYQLTRDITDGLTGNPPEILHPTILDTLMAVDDILYMSLCAANNNRPCNITAWNSNGTNNPYVVRLTTKNSAQPFSLNPIYKVFDQRFIMTSNINNLSSDKLSVFRKSNTSDYPVVQYTVNGYGIVRDLQVFNNNLVAIQQVPVFNSTTNTYDIINDEFVQYGGVDGIQSIAHYSVSNNIFTDYGRINILGSKDDTLYTNTKLQLSSYTDLASQPIPYNSGNRVIIKRLTP